MIKDLMEMEEPFFDPNKAKKAIDDLKRQKDDESKTTKELSLSLGIDPDDKKVNETLIISPRLMNILSEGLAKPRITINELYSR
jgi:hypothetical protein